MITLPATHPSSLYVLTLGRLVRVTHVSHDIDDANLFMARNTGSSVIAEFAQGDERIICIADYNDKGQPFKRRAVYETCPECEASFDKGLDGLLPIHRYLGKPCPGSGRKV